MNSRGFIIIGAIILFVFIGIVFAAASGSHKPATQTAGLCSCTINSEAGMYSVQITNDNTHKSIIRTAADLPYTFNFTSGDTLRFNITTLKEYRWNAWLINVTPWFAQDNPLIILRAETSFTLTANFLIVDQ